MSREIKFRAWDKVHIHMVELGSHGELKYDDEVAKLIFGEDFHDDFMSSGVAYFELLQFTGLKDKNGREIYEGDILRGYHAILTDAPIHQVYWDRGGFVVRNGKGMRYNIGDVEYGDMEIIGNIYENPELLKKDGNA